MEFWQSIYIWGVLNVEASEKLVSPIKLSSLDRAQAGPIAMGKQLYGNLILERERLHFP